jgi:hypothetical protein
MHFILQTALVGAAIIAPCAGLAAFDRSETSLRYTTGTTWSGHQAVYEHSDGRIFADNKPRNIGFFAGGNPGVVAFGCEGTSAPIIAMEKSDLPRCERVEPIANRRTYLEVR